MDRLRTAIKLACERTTTAHQRAIPAPPRAPPSIFTGTVVARKALREDAHRFAASGLDPFLHPGALAAMSSTPQPAARIGSPFAPLNHQTPSQGSTPRPAGLSPIEIRDARGIQSA